MRRDAPTRRRSPAGSLPDEVAGDELLGRTWPRRSTTRAARNAGFTCRSRGRPPTSGHQRGAGTPAAWRRRRPSSSTSPPATSSSTSRETVDRVKAAVAARRPHARRARRIARTVCEHQRRFGLAACLAGAGPLPAASAESDIPCPHSADGIMFDGTTNTSGGSPMVRAPHPEDRFSFGLWTVGWTGVDPFGTATRPALAPQEYAERLAELGAWGVTFHDNDVFPFDADDADAASRSARRSRRPTDAAGLVIEMVTTNTFTPPGLQGRRRSPATTARVRRFGLRKVLRAVDLAAEHGRDHVRDVGRPRGQRVRRLQGPARRVRPLQGGPRHRRRLHQGAGLRPADRVWSPSPTSLAATSSCPPSGTRSP